MQKEITALAPSTMKIKVKKVDKARFRLQNLLAEPFGIYEVALEFVENGKYKGR